MFHLERHAGEPYCPFLLVESTNLKGLTPTTWYDSETRFRSYSQGFQDFIAWKIHVLLGGDPELGTFLDLGSGDPVIWSNTLALEQRGWTGVRVDLNKFSNEGVRSSPKVQGDLGKDTKILESLNKKRVDYISLDLDENTVPVLKKLLEEDISWEILSVEHDLYSGSTRKQDIETLLLPLGFSRVVNNLRYKGDPWEDVWLDRSYGSFLPIWDGVECLEVANDLLGHDSEKFSSMMRVR